MSYILDALRRADAERSQSTGALPSDIGAQVPGVRPAPPQRPGAGRWAVMAVLALATAGALWWVARAKTPPPPPPVREQAAPAALPREVAAVAPPLLAPNAAPRSADPILAPQPATPVTPVGKPPAQPSSPEPPGKPAQTQTPPPPVAGPPTAPAPVTPSTPAPALKVTGATYSDNPAHRMLIVNGRVVLEGQEVEPGLTLEVITPHSAVLNQRGNRFNINY